MNTMIRRPVVRGALLAVAASSALVLSACGNGNAPPNNGAASHVGNLVQVDPHSFVGKQVTLAGEVGQVFGPGVFSVVPGGGAGGANPPSMSSGSSTGPTSAMLVVTKQQVDLSAAAPVQLTGPVVADFTPDAVQGYLGRNLTNAGVNAFVGQPFVEADFVTPTVSADLIHGRQGAFFGTGA